MVKTYSASDILHNRKLLGLTQVELVKYLQISRSALARWEAGIVAPPPAMNAFMWLFFESTWNQEALGHVPRMQFPELLENPLKPKRPKSQPDSSLPGNSPESGNGIEIVTDPEPPEPSPGLTRPPKGSMPHSNAATVVNETRDTSDPKFIKIVQTKSDGTKTETFQFPKVDREWDGLSPLPPKSTLPKP